MNSTTRTSFNLSISVLRFQLGRFEDTTKYISTADVEVVFAAFAFCHAILLPTDFTRCSGNWTQILSKSRIKQVHHGALGVSAVCLGTAKPPFQAHTSLRFSYI